MGLVFEVSRWLNNIFLRIDMCLDPLVFGLTIMVTGGSALVAGFLLGYVSVRKGWLQ